MECVIVKSYDATFFLQNFASDFFPCFRKVRISKITGIPFPEKLGWNINFKNGQIWVIIGMVEKTENFCGRSYRI